MTLYTKSIHAKSESQDGIRICVMRFIKDTYQYDRWIPDLAPSKELWVKYNKTRSIDWNGFEQ